MHLLSLKTKAGKLFEYLKKRNYEIILPAPALGEYLVKIPEEERISVIASLAEVFL